MKKLRACYKVQQQFLDRLKIDGVQGVDSIIKRGIANELGKGIANEYELKIETTVDKISPMLEVRYEVELFVLSYDEYVELTNIIKRNKDKFSETEYEAVKKVLS